MKKNSSLQPYKVRLLERFLYLISVCLLMTQTQPSLSVDIENIPVAESNAIQKIVNMIEHDVWVASKNEPARRDANPKAHGCVMAKFSVLHSLPKKLRIGIFKEFRDFPAWVRFSNGSSKIQDDSVGDGRGMAIKLMAVENSKSTTQDFVMINHPVFFVRNAAEYVGFQQAISDGSATQFFFPTLNPFKFRLHEFRIFNEIKDKDVTDPLSVQYWSQTPYCLGQSAMKFSARPCKQSTPLPVSSFPNFLRENMARHLENSAACFDFMVQIQTQIPDMPIEDPTIEWSETISPYIPVARISIPPQQFTLTNQNEFCDNLSFTPWHSIPEHRPLGGINRVRKAVYETVSRVRHEINGQRRAEPRKF